MKRYLLLIVIMLAILTGCESTKLSTAEVNSLQTKVESHSFTADFNYCQPLRMPARTLTSEYSVVLSPDTLQSSLSYFGQARNVPYGGGTALNFKEKIRSVSDKRVKGDWRTISVVVNHEGDNVIYDFHIFDNGKVMLDVTSRERDFISFQGQIR